MSALQEEDRLLIRDAVDRFIDDRCAFGERDERPEQESRYGENWSTFAELGWLALPFGEDHGGLGGGVEDLQVLMRAFGRGLIAEPYLEVILAGKVLEAIGSDLLAPVITGESIVILAHGEEHTGARFDDLQCRATRSDDGFTLVGSKRVVWQAGAADWLLVSAMTPQGLTLFRVPRDAPGLVFEEFSTIDSRYAADIHLREVIVGEDAALAQGELVESAISQAIIYGYAALLGEASGIVTELVANTAEYLNTREQFGAKLASFQALQHKLADMVIAAEEIVSLEWLVAGAADLDDLDERERVIRSSRARAGSLSRLLGESAVQLHGGVGVSDELVVGHYLRRLIAIDTFYGSGQQQLLWLAEQY